MGCHTRPLSPPPVAPLRIGDLVRVAVRTGGGPEAWTGTVVDHLDRWGLVRVSDGRRSRLVAVRGAAYVEVLAPAVECLGLAA